jgi:hypothetical protein
MLVMTIYSGLSKIEFHIAFFGHEMNVANREVVSSKHTFTATDHQFTIKEQGKLVTYKLITALGSQGLAVDRYRNLCPIILSSRKGFWAILLLLLIALFCLVF